VIATISASDAGILAAVVVVLAFLVYRLFKREPLDRIVRFGVFIERRRFTEDKNEVVTERREWPRQKEEDL
jgi:hypothetical protein